MVFKDLESFNHPELFLDSKYDLYAKMLKSSQTNHVLKAELISTRIVITVINY